MPLWNIHSSIQQYSQQNKILWTLLCSKHYCLLRSSLVPLPDLNPLTFLLKTLTHLTSLCLKCLSPFGERVNKAECNILDELFSCSIKNTMRLSSELAVSFIKLALSFIVALKWFSFYFHSMAFLGLLEFVTWSLLSFVKLDLQILCPILSFSPVGFQVHKC